MSKSLTKAERNYSQIELEALSIIFGTRKFRHFLLGRKFVLRTDHRPLLTVFDPTKLTTPTRTSGRLARWALQLSQYDYEIQYRRSVEHGNADCLSRLPVGHEEDFEQTNEYEDQSERYIAAMESRFIKDAPILFDQLQRYTKQDRTLQQVMKFINDGWPSTVKTKALLDFVACQHQLSVCDGCILKHAEEPRIAVPKAIREQLLSELHKAHVGMERMKKLARRFIWWPGIDRDIESMARNCENCAVHADRPPEVPLHLWEFPECPWARIYIDFAGPICKKCGLLWSMSSQNGLR